jgi:hypothetical protein
MKWCGQKDGTAGRAVWQCNEAHAFLMPNNYIKNNDPVYLVLIAFPRQHWSRERVIIHFARIVPYLPDYMISRTGRPQCERSFFLSYKFSKYCAVTHKHGRSLRCESERCREETSKIRVKSSSLYRRNGSRKRLEDFHHPRLLVGDTGCCVRWCHVVLCTLLAAKSTKYSNMSTIHARKTSKMHNFC